MSSAKQVRNWPKETSQLYDPVSDLGRGGFALVVLAKRKNTREGDIDHLVAMKQVGAVSKKEFSYAQRELRILKEISHPNIMKVIDSWETGGNVTMALTYGGIKTLEYILERAGAPSLDFSRVVIAQLVDAIAFLHSHAVIHRDIKPDNVVIKDFDIDDNAIFVEEKRRDLASLHSFRKKFHVTLVDFGFARALRPEDFHENVRKSQKPYADVNIDQAIVGRKARKTKLDLDVSRSNKLNMSAVGNRYYAAPEVKDKVKQASKTGTSITSTLSEYVSDYGMLADAFSLGATARYMLTGVRPEDNVEEVIARNNNPIVKLFQKLCCMSNSGRAKHYRSGFELPTSELQVLKGLTQSSLEKRMSVRDVRMLPYVDEVLDKHNYRKELSFLTLKGESSSAKITGHKTKMLRTPRVVQKKTNYYSVEEKKDDGAMDC